MLVNLYLYIYIRTHIPGTCLSFVLELLPFTPIKTAKGHRVPGMVHDSLGVFNSFQRYIQESLNYQFSGNQPTPKDLGPSNGRV